MTALSARHRCRISFIGGALLCALLAASAGAYQAVPPFWASAIDSALRTRDAFFKSILSDTTGFSLVSLSNMEQKALCERLDSIDNKNNPWHHFARCILQCGKSASSSESCFATALFLARQDPGTVWALYVECVRNRQPVWAERCLTHLEKLMLAAGARSVPAIAHQLLWYAASSEKQRDYPAASGFYSWAERFDPQQPWSAFRRAAMNLPGNPGQAMTSLNDIADMFSRSWVLQLAALSQVCFWLKLFLLCFVVIVFAGIGLRYFPQSMHSILDRLPEEIPAPFKTAAATGVMCSFLSFGLIPFLWLASFCIWRFLGKKEKVLAFLALLVLAGMPLGARVQDMFNQARSPESSLTLYKRATQEGYSADVHRQALKKIIINPEDAFACMTASLCALRLGDSSDARLNAEKALVLRPNDPVFMLHAGIAAYETNDIKSAVRIFQQVLDRHPDNAAARFNLAQCFARNSDTAIDLDFLRILPPGDQNAINEFVNINNAYFLKNWPLRRQCIAPAYRPTDFWLTVFPANDGSWNTTRVLWGASFLGVPPYASVFLSLALLVALFVWSYSGPVQRRLKQLSFCRLCRRAICRRCKKGELCPSCSHHTQFIRNVKTLAAIQSKIMRNQRALQAAVESVLDIGAPGCGRLFSGTRSHAGTVALVLLTCAVYATFFTVSNLQFSYPRWVLYGALEYLPYCLFAYNVIFATRICIALFRKNLISSA